MGIPTYMLHPQKNISMSGYGGSTVILMVETEFPETIWFWRLAEFVRSRFKNPCSVNTLRVVEKDFWSLHSCEYTYTPVPLSTHAHMLKKHVLTALSVHKKLFFLSDNVFEILNGVLFIYLAYTTFVPW